MEATDVAPITRFEDLDLSKRYTYADYVTWKFKERVELFRGWVERMSAPNVYHQRVSSELFRRMGNALVSRGCFIFSAPTDVRLRRSPEGDTVVQPDLFAVCDEAKLTKQYIEGAPDWIIEIVSPGNGKKELEKKYGQYEEAGVREYWVVDPMERTILRYVLNGEGVYVGLAPRTEDSAAVDCTIFEGVSFSGAAIFP